MKRRNYNHKEQDELQKLKRENDKLKKQVSSLRKQLARIDIDRYENLQDLIHKYDKENAEEMMVQQQKAKEEKWKCFECGTGILRLKLIERLDGMIYYRACDCCSNRTKTQRWNKTVEGV